MTDCADLMASIGDPILVEVFGVASIALPEQSSEKKKCVFSLKKYKNTYSPYLARK